MIPVSLSLRNFLSYGDEAPTLDFTDFSIACITGRNGHGKSALFDAITWALWGEARKASSDRKPDEGLLRIGATDLRVEFVFDLEGQRFRVSRSYRKTARSGSSSLELQIFDAETDRYRSLSESSSIRKTQARIDCLIRVSYDTFVNSAFILQGRVDEFTRRSPTDRKAILADILELSRYDALSARARERARQSDSEVERAKEKLARIDEAAAKREEILERLVTARSELTDAENAASTLEKDLETCTAALARTEAAVAQVTALNAELNGLRLRLRETRDESARLQEEAAVCRNAMADADGIHKRVDRLKELRGQEQKLRASQTMLQALELEQTRLEAEIAAARTKVETRRDHWTKTVDDLENGIREGEKKLASRPKIERALSELAELREKEREVIALRDKRESIEARRRDIEAAFNTKRSGIQVEIEAGKKRRSELQKLLDQRTALERDYNDARQHLDTFTALNEEMDRVKREGTEAQQTEERLSERIEGVSERRKQVIAQTEQLQSHDDPDCPLCGSDLDDAHREEVLSQLGKDAEESAWQRENAMKDMSAAKERRDRCRAAYQKLRDQVHQLTDAPRNFARAEAALNSVSTVNDDLEALVETIQSLEDQAKDYETSSDEAVELGRIRKELESLAKATEQQDDLRKQIDALAGVEVEMSRMDELQERVDEAAKALPDAKEKLNAAHDWLAEKRYAIEEYERLLAIGAEINALAYDKSAHKDIIEEIEALKAAEEDLKALQEAEGRLAIAQTKLETAGERVTEIDGQIAKTEEALKSIGDPATERATLKEKRTTLSSGLDELRKARDTALTAVASLERDDAHCKELISKRKDVVEELATHEKDVTVYRELVKAFGKDGIQALLIDQAIPELQDEANRILSRLTSNGTQVTLESLGELKSGGTKETLDIRISDELGERRYELYSGGEAFRVDFAIRIALSKLLAHRSGTPLQTLVIDEGFGTQDEQGLSHLIEAIQTISDEFEKVLVITHVETIKNAFPVRIEVVKHPESGSTFNIVN